jgi:N-carbamoyl-L-amino-acid hydrolase
MNHSAPQSRFTADEHALASALFANIAQISADTRGVSRPAWSAKETEVLDYLSDVATKEGLAVWPDALDNRIFSLPEDHKATSYLLLGSHVDSVPMGGNFDGLAGVVAGLICLIHQARSGQRFARPVRLIAMRGEESAWFGPCYMASKALTGTLSQDELAAAHRGDGLSLAEHMTAMGIDTAPIAAGQPLMSMNAITEYIELHIEQGPLLTAEHCPAAVVTGICGNLRFKSIMARGEAGHSGAVPRAYRHDPVMATAKLLATMDQHWAQALEADDDLVMTAGMIGTDPASHSMARIPDEVTFSFEVRSQSQATMDRLEALLYQEMGRISEETGVAFDLPAAIRTAPAALDTALQARLLNAQTQTGQKPMAIASGGGHDAAIFANAGVRAGMVFVRSEGGSHNPAEAMTIEDLIAGASILLAYANQDMLDSAPLLKNGSSRQ